MTPWVRDLASVAEALVCLARLSALTLLREERMTDQRDRARETVLWIGHATRLARFLERHCNVKPARVAWPSALRPDRCGLIGDGPASTDRLRGAVDELAHSVAARVRSFGAVVPISSLPPRLAPHLRRLSVALPASPRQRASRPLPLTRPRARGVVQALRGPRHVPLDPIFAPTFSLLHHSELALNLRELDSSPQLWCLSIRETMAAELCALSIVEYDGLPLAFYRDFAQQASDEMRHALFFFDCAMQLLPQFVASARRDHPMMEGVRRYLATGHGLPVPLERNLYEVAWNATLTDRLILMHLDDEVPAVAAFEQQLKSSFWRRRPELARGLELTTHEEVAHARFGRTWLAHLLPDHVERQRAVAQARLLRGVLMLAAVSQYNGVPLQELMTRFATPRARRGDPARRRASARKGI